MGNSESYGTSEELSEGSHTGSLTEKARGVAELDLHGEERVLHGNANSDSGENLKADQPGNRRVLVDSVEKTGADGEEGRSGDEEWPVSADDTDDATRDDDGKHNGKHEGEDVDARFGGAVLAGDLVEDGEVCEGKAGEVSKGRQRTEELYTRTVGEDEEAETSGECVGNDGKDGAAKKPCQSALSARWKITAHKFLKMAGGTMALSPR